jgi:hypothetical protein
MLARKEFDGLYVWEKGKISSQDAQKVRPARPQPMKAPEA